MPRGAGDGGSELIRLDRIDPRTRTPTPDAVQSPFTQSKRLSQVAAANPGIARTRIRARACNPHLNIAHTYRSTPTRFTPPVPSNERRRGNYLTRRSPALTDVCGRGMLLGWHRCASTATPRARRGPPCRTGESTHLPSRRAGVNHRSLAPPGPSRTVAGRPYSPAA